MTDSTPSDEQKLLIAGYVLNDLSPEEAADFEQLILAHPDWVQECEDLQQVLESAYAPPAVEPPAHLRASILSAFQSTTQAASATPSSPLRQVSPLSASARQAQPQWSWLTGWRTAAALLIVGLSASNFILWRKLQIAQIPPDPSDVLIVSLASTADQQEGGATVIVDAANLEATLEVENLPPLPEGQVYVLWTVLQPDAPFTTDDKGAILTEVFNGNGQTAASSIALPPVYRQPEWIRAIAITIEAADAPQRHESSPILIEML